MAYFKRTLVIVCAVLMVLSSPSWAGGQDFELKNRTGVDIHRIFVSPSGVDDWEEDVLKEDVLMNGEDLLIQFPRSESSEWWDIRVEDSDGNAIEFERINLFEAITVILKANGKALIE